MSTETELQPAVRPSSVRRDSRRKGSERRHHRRPLTSGCDDNSQGRRIRGFCGVYVFTQNKKIPIFSNRLHLRVSVNVVSVAD